MWLQAAGGALVLLGVVFFLGHIALDSLREFLWKANQSKRETLRVLIGAELMDVSHWIYGDTREGCMALQIIAEKLKRGEGLSSDNIRQELRRRIEVDTIDKS